RNLGTRRMKATVEVDGKRFFQGPVSCVLAANVGTIMGGIEAFPDARPDDGLLELGVVTAKNPVEWARVFGRLTLGRAEDSPFAEITRGTKFTIRFDRKVPYELDGGVRPARREVQIKARPRSITICVPAEAPAVSAGTARGKDVWTVAPRAVAHPCRPIPSTAGIAVSRRSSRGPSRRRSSPSCS